MSAAGTGSIFCDEADRRRTSPLNLKRTPGGFRLLVTVLWAALAWSPAWGPRLALASGGKVLLKNEIPYGEREGGLLAQGAGISGLLCVESRAQRYLRVELAVHVPGPLVAGSDDGRLRISRNQNGAVVDAVFPLRVEGEKWFSSFAITVPHETPVGEYVVRAVARVWDEDGEEVVEQVTRLMVVSRDVIPALFRVGEPAVPCNVKGEPEDRLERSTVLIQGRKAFWRRLVEDGKRTSRFDAKPSTYLSVPVQNTGPYKAILLVRMDVLDPATGERVPGFELPHAAEHGDNLGEVAVYQVVEMDPESEERVVLPFFVSAEAVRPGIYSARIRTVLFGTDIEVDSREVSIRVVGVRRLPALMTAVALLTSLGGMLFALGQRKRYLAMQSRDLILIALFGTVMFTVVTIPGTLFLHAAHVLLGPVSCRGGGGCTGGVCWVRGGGGVGQLRARGIQPPLGFIPRDDGRLPRGRRLTFGFQPGTTGWRAGSLRAETDSSGRRGPGLDRRLPELRVLQSQHVLLPVVLRRLVSHGVSRHQRVSVHVHRRPLRVQAGRTAQGDRQCVTPSSRSRN